jgi:hypothetical protein
MTIQIFTPPPFPFVFLRPFLMNYMFQLKNQYIREIAQGFNVSTQTPCFEMECT